MSPQREKDQYLGSSTFAWHVEMDNASWLKQEEKTLRETRQKLRIQALPTNYSDLLILGELAKYQTAAHSGIPVTCVAIALLDISNLKIALSHYQTLTPKNIWEAGKSNTIKTQGRLDQFNKSGLTNPSLIRDLLPFPYRFDTITQAFNECVRLINSPPSTPLVLLASGIFYNTPEENQLSLDHLARLANIYSHIDIQSRFGDKIGIFASLNHQKLSGFGFNNYLTNETNTLGNFSS